jgi:transcriptional regulator with XRE-family HTH domain
MPATPNPVVDRLLLAKELRRLRDEKGLTQQQVADKLQWSREKVGRIETASNSVSPPDVRRLLHLYEVVDTNVLDELEQRAEAAQRPGWNEFRGLLPGRYLTYLGFEEIATTMRQFHLSLIPGLLQTRAYMREVLTYVHEISPRDVRRLIEARSRRQQLLTAEQRPTFKIIIDEAVLRRPIGGNRVWREQLEHLQKVNQLDRVELMVLPLSVGPHPGMKGAFNLLTFEDAPYDDLLYIENSEGDRIDRDDDEVIVEYMQIFEELESKSIGGEKFDEMVAKIADLFTWQTMRTGSSKHTFAETRQPILRVPRPPMGALVNEAIPPVGSEPSRHRALGKECLAAAPQRPCRHAPSEGPGKHAGSHSQIGSEWCRYERWVVSASSPGSPYSWPGRARCEIAKGAASCPYS